MKNKALTIKSPGMETTTTLQSNPRMHDNIAEVYTDIEAEYDAAVRSAALVDRSTVGKIELLGGDALDLLHRLSTNDLSRIGRGGVAPTVLVTEKGRVIDYILVVVLPDRIMLLVSAGNEQRVASWIEKFTIMEDVRSHVASTNFRLFALIGPMAKEIGENLLARGIESDTIIIGEIGSTPVHAWYRKAFETDWLDMMVEERAAEKLCRYLDVRRQELGFSLMGATAYEVFRITRGIPTLGHELSDAFNPFEVGLRPAISFTKGCYIGQEVIARLDTYQKVQRTLWGILFDQHASVASGSTLMCDGEEVGVLTSSSTIGIRGRRCGLAVLKIHRVHSDDPIGILGSHGIVQGVRAALPVLL